MEFITTLLTDSPYLNWPGEIGASLLGYTVWLALLAVGLYLLWKWRKYQNSWTSRSWWIFFGLAAAAPLTSLFLGVRLLAPNALPPRGLPVETPGPALMVFLAVPNCLPIGSMLCALGDT